MITPALNGFADLLAPAAGTAPATTVGPAAGPAFTARLSTMLPAAEATLPGSADLLTPVLPVATEAQAMTALPVTPDDAAESPDETLALLLPGLALGETDQRAPGAAARLPASAATDTDADSDALATDAAATTPAWLAALPLPVAMPAVATATAAAPTLVQDVLAGASAAAMAASAGQPPLRRADTGQGGKPELMLPAGQAAVAMPATAAATAEATPGTDEATAPALALATTTVSTPSTLLGQGLEGLLRSREGRLVRNIEGGGELTAVSLPAQVAQAVASAGGREPVVLTIPQHAVPGPDWSDAFSQHVVTLAQQGSQSASLQLNPEDLGPIHVRVSVHDQAASVEFAARHAATSDLIESALPRLAHALENQGLRLDDVRMSQLPARAEGFSLASGGQQGQQQASDGRGQGGGTAPVTPVEARQVPARHVDTAGPDGVDAYA